MSVILIVPIFLESRLPNSSIRWFVSLSMPVSMSLLLASSNLTSNNKDSKCLYSKCVSVGSKLLIMIFYSLGVSKAHDTIDFLNSLIVILPVYFSSIPRNFLFIIEPVFTISS